MLGAGRLGEGRERRPVRFSPVVIILLMALLLGAAGASRLARLAPRADAPLMPDMVGFTQKAQRLSWSQLFFYEMEPMTIWVNRASQEAGAWFGMGVNRSVRAGTLALGSLMVVWFFFLARAWMGDAGALCASLYLALSPYLSVTDVTGGRDATYLLTLVGFCFFAFRPGGGLAARVLGMGFMGGLVCLTRLNGLFIVIPVALAVWVKMLGFGFWRPWLATTLLALAITAPFVAHVWGQTGDPLYTLNSHADWHSAEDPDSKTVTSFFEMFFGQLGPLALAKKTLKGMYDSLAGPVARDSFFAAGSLPYGLFLAPYLTYLLGMAVSGWRLLWGPFLVICLATGPVWPLIAAGTDPRLLLGALPFMAVFLGVGAETLLKAVGVGRLDRGGASSY